MLQTNARTPTRAHDHDDVIILEGATWQDFERLLAVRGERSAPRMAYLDGRIELMCPCYRHEAIKSLLGRLVEAWCLHAGVRFHTVGAWLLKNPGAEKGLEPDECYFFGVPDPEPQRPHLAIEVVWSQRMNKLEIYRGLGIPEVWVWKDGMLTVHVLRDGSYAPTDASTVLPDLDLPQLLSFLDRPTTFDAIRDYRAALEQG